MEFLRARTDEQVASRQEEIITVCDEIYREKGYEAVHFKAVSRKTSISRPSIYNYYKTKEEIFLDILQRDFTKWTEELKSHFDAVSKMTKEEFCAFLADTLVKHEKYFELLAVYMPSIEKNSSLEKLIAFKREIQPFSKVFIVGLDKFFPDAKDEQKRRFYFNFQAVVHGVYPLTHYSEKQIQASKKVISKFKLPDFRHMCLNALLILIADL
jgi:AcrR family transcriptional regulator